MVPGIDMTKVGCNPRHSASTPSVRAKRTPVASNPACALASDVMGMLMPAICCRTLMTSSCQGLNSGDQATAHVGISEDESSQCKWVRTGVATNDVMIEPAQALAAATPCVQIRDKASC
jgi:hypothetical protein